MTKPDVDNHKLMYHPKRVTEWLEKGDCAPIYVEIGLTNRCNHKCSFCALDFLERGGVDIDKEILYKSLENMADCGVKSIMFAGEGEPLLYKNISETIKKTKEHGIDVSITTNGVMLTPEKADNILPYLSWIRFSIDAGTPKTYSKLHGTNEKDFEKLMKNIQYVSDIKKKNNLNVTIGTQALLTNQSLPEIIKLAETLKQIGADNLQIKPYSHHPSSKNDLSFDYDEAEWIRDKLNSISNKNFEIFYRTNTIQRLNSGRDYSECHGLPFFALIDARGDIVPCNMFYNNQEFTYGNLYKNKFSEIWASDNRKQILEKINKKGIESCRNGCRLDVINRYLDRLKNPRPHDNFI